MDPQSSALDTGFVPSRATRAPATAFAKVVEWLDQATKFAATALNTDEPNDGLLLEALSEWRIGFACQPELIRVHGRKAIRVAFNKPRGEGQTTRDLDVAVVAFSMLLCSPGGRLTLEDHGPVGGYYYARLYIHGRRPDGQRRRTYFLRLAADTPPGQKTKEPKNYRSVLRHDLGTYEQDPDGEEPMVLYGTSDAKRDSVDRWRELERTRPAALPAQISADEFATRLDQAHNLLSQVPLGTDPAS